MNISGNKPELIQPGIFKDEPGMQAWFTLKNAGRIHSSETPPGLNLGFNTASGPEVVTKNRELLFKGLGLDPDRVAFGRQVHGTRIQFITNGGVYSGTDGLITNIPGLALAIQVADCAAVLLAEPEKRTVAAVHAGWRGAAGNIVPKTIKIMSSNGGNPSCMKAFISPCISSRHFEVDEEVAEQFPNEFVDRKSYKKPHVDLKEFLKYQMMQAGMKQEFIEVDGGCTIGDSKRFYSYRREKNKSGRMLGIIKLA